MALVSLTTDFGTVDPFVGIMKAVILGRAPDARLVDVSHEVPFANILAGALVLRHAVPYFPAGSVHLAVVDPGVGGARRPLCVETKSGFLVGPDNGVLSLAANDAGILRIIHLTEERFFLSPASGTFHGRDVFAPVAAALAGGTKTDALGPQVEDMVRLEVPSVVTDGSALRGQVVYVDRFGNLVTNISAPSRVVRVSLGNARIEGLARSYSDAPVGEPVAVVNSWGVIEIAVREGSAQAKLGARVGDPVVIETA
jgi:S-adenosylmethionine hydrolase